MIEAAVADRTDPCVDVVSLVSLLMPCVLYLSRQIPPGSVGSPVTGNVKSSNGSTEARQNSEDDTMDVRGLSL